MRFINLNGYNCIHTNNFLCNSYIRNNLTYMPTNITLNPDGSFPIQQIEAELYARTEEYSLETWPSSHRKHLGASVIGEKCYRKLWYIFRWVKLEQFIGRMRRLFNRGHSEEEKIDNILTYMGLFTREIDPLTNRQYRFSAVHGHYGGSGDTIALLPWFRDESQRILVEKKTHKDKLYKKLKDGKLKDTVPKHYIQMCTYGKAFQIRYGLYVAVNKDDDDIHYELMELDWNVAVEMENKAKDIIFSELPPKRISENPAYYECTYCTFKGICHNNEPVEINCRSCKMASPADNAEWFCKRYNMNIPTDAIQHGCGNHQSVNN